jgi:hypothetical protein
MIITMSSFMDGNLDGFTVIPNPEEYSKAGFVPMAD